MAKHKKKKKKKRAAAPDPAEVFIFHTNDDETCTVSPSKVPLVIGQKVTWHNTTNDEVVVLFPHDGLSTAKGFKQPINAHDEATSKPAKKKGTFKYYIWCEETGNFAVGTDPEIIVS